MGLRKNNRRVETEGIKEKLKLHTKIHSEDSVKKVLPIIFAFIVALIFFSKSVNAQNIFEAVRQGDIESVKTLVGNNPHIIDERDTMQRTPLHWAARTNQSEILTYLIEKGAAVNTLDVNNYSPLLLAISNEYRSLVKILINAGADVNLKNLFDMSALHYAIRYEYFDEAEIIINKAAYLNAKIYNGQTSLHLACYGGKSNILKLLLDSGGKTDVTDLAGNTPLHTAVYFGDIKAVELLLNYKADINAKNNFGRTPLHQAGVSGYGEIARELLDSNARVEIKDSSDQTPSNLAESHNNKKIIELFRAVRKQKGNNLHVNDNELDLKKELEYGEAIIWHLGNCGWAVKTKSKLLIFDYWNYGAMPDEPSLANGRITPEEIGNFDVYFFVSHAHYDHYDKSIFNFECASKNVKYVFGWKAMDNPSYCYFTENRLTRVIDGIEISNIYYNSESAFLVRVDGLTIYHGGDYLGDYKTDHDYLAEKQDSIDILFSDYDYHEDVCISAIEKLKPKVMFPMHCYGFEYLLQHQANTVSQEFPHLNVIAIKDRGDKFFYGNGSIK